MYNAAGEQWKAGLSLLNTTLDFQSAGGAIPSGSLGANVTALSLQRNFAKLSLIAEYSLLTSTANFGLSSNSTKSESLYAQAEYQTNAQWTGFVRIDNQLGDRDQPNETDSLVATLGARWKPTKNWLLAAEIHGMRGTAGIQRPDNNINPLYARTELFVIMAGFRF
jgi:hypothetical protein